MSTEKQIKQRKLFEINGWMKGCQTRVGQFLSNDDTPDEFEECLLAINAAAYNITSKIEKEFELRRKVKNNKIVKGAHRAKENC
jgi:Iap family predicted aminopeptidase